MLGTPRHHLFLFITIDITSSSSFPISSPLSTLITATSHFSYFSQSVTISIIFLLHHQHDRHQWNSLLHLFSLSLTLTCLIITSPSLSLTITNFTIPTSHYHSLSPISLCLPITRSSLSLTISRLFIHTITITAPQSSPKVHSLSFTITSLITITIIPTVP